MKKTSLKINLVLALFFIFLATCIQAKPMWEFKALTPTQIFLPKNGTAIVQYLITYNSSKQHGLMMDAIAGIRQITDPGLCSNPLILPLNGSNSCTLSLLVDGSQMTSDITDGPSLCNRGSHLQCYRPRQEDVLMITRVAEQYTVGGTITGLTGTIVLLNNGSNPLTQSTDGTFTFTKTLGSGDAYSVTIQSQPLDQTCTVTHGTGVIQTKNITLVNVVCSTNAYTVGGSVSGLSGSVELTNNGTDNLVIQNDGNFTFPTAIAEGSNYEVAIKTQPEGQICTVNNGTGTMGGANVTNVRVICSMNSHTVGGVVSGLTGSVTLLNNGSDDKVINSNGNYVFSTSIAEGSNYNVTVGSQPSGQTCSVSNGSGTMGNTDVTNVNITCSNNTTTLSVNPTGTIPASSTATTNDILVTNTGTTIAYNVHMVLPSGWTAVSQNASDCSVLYPDQTKPCKLTFSSRQAYVAQGNVLVTGDNITNPPTMAIAFTVTDQNYLVWQVSGLNLLVIDTADISPTQEWGGFFTAIGPSAQDFYDGLDNTTNIVATLGTGSNYAAEACNLKNPGGTWYLPALCQMGTGTSCLSGVANINSNLVQLGFGGLGTGLYWSSTEKSTQSQAIAWCQQFGASSVQNDTTTKNTPLSVRCVRSVTVTRKIGGYD